MSRNVDYFTLKQEESSIKFKIKAQNDVNITLYDINSLSIMCDGIPFPAWTSQNNGTILIISTDSNTHEFEIFTTPVTKINHPPVLEPIGNKTVSSGSLLSFSVSATDPDNTGLTYSASGLPCDVQRTDPMDSRFGRRHVNVTLGRWFIGDTESITLTVTLFTGLISPVEIRQ
jgi:hypothetical protein